MNGKMACAAAVLLFGSCLAACDLPFWASSEGGGVPHETIAYGTIRLRAKDVALPRSILPPSDRRTATLFNISATGPGTTVNLTDIASSTVDINDLIPGSWTVSVVGKNQYGQAILGGSSPATVSSGGATNITVDLTPLAGTGTIAFALVWPTASAPTPSVQASIKPFGDPETSFLALALGDVETDTPSAGSSTVAYSAWSYDAGIYVVRLVLRSASVEIATVILAATVYPSLDSAQTYTLPYWEISHGPPAPTNLILDASTDTDISLSWQDVSITETGFAVERSPDGSNWTTLAASLPANSVSYADSSLTPNTVYYYRVTAFNDFPGPGVSASQNKRTRWRLADVITDTNLLQAFTDASATYCDEPTSVVATWRGIASLTGLANLPNLGFLNIANNSVADLSPIAGMAQLINLSVSSNPLSNIGQITGLTTLTILQAESCGIVDASPLAAMTGLTALYLKNNAIATGVPTLSALTAATAIDLTGNLLIDPVDIDNLRSALPGCTVSWVQPGTGGLGVVEPTEPTVALSGGVASLPATGGNMTVTATVADGSAAYYWWFLDGVLADHGAAAASYTVTTSGDSWGRRYRLEAVILTTLGISCHAAHVYAISD